MRASAAIWLLVWSMPAMAGDWPCWRGPNHNGISAETGWVDSWPKSGPKILWRANVGTGFCTVSVSGGRLYTTGNKDDTDTVHCVDAETGKPIWQHSYAAPTDPNLFEGGPTATPTVDGDRVYTLSRQGDLICFHAATGKIVWSQNVIKETKQRVPTWGLAGSPLVHRNLLLLNLGDAGVALDKLTGKIVWNSEVKDPGYSSPVPFQRDGQWFAIVSSEDEYVAVNIESGKQMWRIEWPTNYGVNAADPIVRGEQVFLSSGYNKGCGVFKTSEGKVTAVWQNKTLRNQINSSVLVDGFLYGIDGDTSSRTRMRCVDFKTGATRWEEESVGCGSLMAADGRLIILSDRGELVIAKASSEKFQSIARAKVLEGKCWTVPVLANSRIYCRNADGELLCVDVRK